MKKDCARKEKLFLVVVFAVVCFLNLIDSVCAVNFNFTINGKITNSDSGAIFTAGADDRAVSGLDELDKVDFVKRLNGTFFYSTILDNIYLTKDFWNASLFNSRTFNLSYETSPKIMGILNLNWNLYDERFEAYLTDFGENIGLNKNFSNKINMKEVKDYSVFLNGKRQFQLIIIYHSNLLIGYYGQNSSDMAIENFSDLSNNCSEEMICSKWQECLNVESSFKKELISNSEYNSYKTNCNEKQYNMDVCGYQKRECDIDKKCNLSEEDYSQIRICYYSEKPDCKDEIMNCHDEVCEEGVDCGGPCLAHCPTCFDEIINQDEEGVDCGGKCSKECITFFDKIRDKINFEKVSRFLFRVFYVSLALALILFAIYIVRRINKQRRESLAWYNLSK